MQSPTTRTPGDRGVRADAPGPELVGELVGARVELRVGQPLVATLDGHVVGCAGGGRLEELVDRRRRHLGCGAVPLVHEQVPLSGADHRQLLDGALGVRGDAAEQGEVVAEDPLGGVDVEQVVSGLEAHLQAAVAGIVHREDEVGARAAREQRDDRRLEARQRTDEIDVVEVEDHLEQGVNGLVAGQVHRFDDPGQRQLAVRPRPVPRRRGTGHELGERRVAVGVDDDGEAVHERPDERLEARRAGVRERVDAHGPLAAVPA